VLRAMRMKARPPAPPQSSPPAGPTARPPAEEQARRPPKPPSAEPARPQANPGDIYCSSCGTPNDPSRNYCRSCGTQLGAATAAPPVGPARVPWWRRIFGGGRRAGAAAPPPAGTRPAAGKGRSTRGAGEGAINSVAHVARRFFQVVAVLGALGIGVIAIGPWRSDAKDKVRGWLDDARAVIQPRYVKVTPSAISASSSLKADPPENAFDGIIETFWAEGAHGDGTGQALTVTFARPTDLARIGLTVGDQKAPQTFATRPVPRTLELVFYDANGAVVKREQLSLEQTPKFQKRDADAKGVARMVIKITSTYPPVKGARSSAAISEVELFTKD
jgi:zinc ribbon protein